MLMFFFRNIDKTLLKNILCVISRWHFNAAFLIMWVLYRQPPICSPFLALLEKLASIDIISFAGSEGLPFRFAP